LIARVIAGFKYFLQHNRLRISVVKVCLIKTPAPSHQKKSAPKAIPEQPGIHFSAHNWAS